MREMLERDLNNDLSNQIRFRSLKYLLPFFFSTFTFTRELEQAEVRTSLLSLPITQCSSLCKFGRCLLRDELISSDPHNHPAKEVGQPLPLIFHIRKLRFRLLKRFTQSYRAIEWQGSKAWQVGILIFSSSSRSYSLLSVQIRLWFHPSVTCHVCLCQRGEWINSQCSGLLDT